MIRNQLNYRLKTNLAQSVFDVKIQITNKPLFKLPLYIFGANVNETISNMANACVNEIARLGLQDYIRIQYQGDTITFDFPQLGAWGGYGDRFEYEPQYIVHETPNDVIKKYYSQADNQIVNISSKVYDDGTGETPTDLYITGIEKNGYLINNDIYVQVGADAQGTSAYLDVSCTDLQTQKSITSRVYYMNNNTLTIDLAIMVKALMPPPKANFYYNNLQPYPINTNYGKYKFSFQRYFYPLNSEVLTFGSSVEIVKDMYRGGVYAQGSNFNMVYSKLRSVKKLPIWSGYPTAEYTLGANGEIIQNNDLTTVVDKEYRTTDTCNNYYIKFLNQKGGYSYWMFNNQKEDITANNVGYSDVYGLITDFGSNITATFEVSGKIPLDYKALIFDLISSSETYLYQGQNKWSKVVQKSNKLTEATDKRTFDVTFKFELINNFNPTI